MKTIPTLFLFLVSCLYGDNREHWLKSIENRIDPQAIEFVNELNKNAPDIKAFSDLLAKTKPHMPGCKGCNSSDFKEPESTDIYVFMSFSVPKETWLAFSNEMEAHKAVFVVQGLPDNSFKRLAQKIYDMKRAGLRSAVQINPKLFRELNIHQVPAIAVKTREGEWNLVRGAVSIRYALELFQKIPHPKVSS